jgi:uncharacterized membrane protein
MLAAGVYMIVFRIVHILAGIAWAGSVFLFVLFVQPSVAAIAPAGAPFMRELLAKRRMVDGILTLASTTILGGAFLYWHDWQQTGSFGDWVGSTYGAWLTVGAVAALGAFAIGVRVTRPNVHRMLAHGAQIADGGGPPTPEQAEEMQATQARLKVAARVSLGLVGVAAFTMATARYW